MTEVLRIASGRALLLGLALALAGPWAFAQEGAEQPAPPPVEGAPLQGDQSAPETIKIEGNPNAPTEAELAAMGAVQHQYSDPSGRYRFTAPARWGRLASSAPDEVTFLGPTGDSVRVTVAPLEVKRQAFMSAYVDTYLSVLSQTFQDVKYLGQRSVQMSNTEAVDFIYSATYKEVPVTCHQVVVFAQERVIYVTFAGFGGSRQLSEQLFLASLFTFWVNPSLLARPTAELADPNAPAFILAIPEGWLEQDVGSRNSHVFRPAGARPTSAYIATSVAKPPAGDEFTTVNSAFIEEYAQRIASGFPAQTFTLRAKTSIGLGGEMAARYDFGYISNYGVRRAILVICVRDGFLVSVGCDAAEQGFPIYEGAFENLISTFRFKNRAGS